MTDTFQVQVDNFEEIPIMYVNKLMPAGIRIRLAMNVLYNVIHLSSCGYALTFYSIRDLKNLKSQDPADRRRIADEVRNACIQVGFFYGLDLQVAFFWDT